jgi:PAS domain S-box-containing protein
MESGPSIGKTAVNILLVDDEARNLDVLESILDSPGYCLIRAQTPQEALMALLDGEFAAIVLDIQMPVTNGLELAQLIKQRKRTQHIPIIFLTAFFQEDKDVLHGYEVGAVDYLTKPVDPQILRSKIAVFVDLFRKTRELLALNLAMALEITQRKLAEEALRQSKSELENRVQERVAAYAELLFQKETQTRLFDATLSSITDLAYTFDRQGNWIYANKPLLELWGKTLPEITGKSSLELGYSPELAERLRAQVAEVIATRKPVRGETFYTDAKGVEDYHEYIFSPVFAADGSVSAVCGTTRLTTERKRTEAVAECQRRVLQLIAEDAPLEQVLDGLVRTGELEAPGKVAGAVMLLDLDGVHLRVGAAPSLPKDFVKACNGIPAGEGPGSCISTTSPPRPVYAMNIAGDPLWVRLKEYALAHGLRACWSIPILSRKGGLLGVLAVYHSEPHQPSDKDLKTIEMASRTAAIAIERKQSDAVLRESERRYSQLVSSLPAAVYTTDAQGRVTLYNEAAVLLWGRRLEAGTDLWDGSFRLYRADGTPLPAEESPMAVTLNEGRPVRGQEIVIERADGTLRNVLPYPDPIRDASGKVVGAVNLLLDITESKRAEEASRRLAAIVESSKDAIISTDLCGIISTWNRGAERLFGFRAEEVVGRSVSLLMPPKDWKEEPSIVDRVRRDEWVEHYETVRRRKDGRIVDVSLTVSPIRNAGDQVIGASKIVRDITAQKQAERELERAHQEAVSASRAKDDFLAALSHELRTPLNPVLLLASEAAEDSRLPAEIRSQFATIRLNVELEARLIDDLLDLTHIHHGKLSLNLEVVDIHALLRKAFETVRSEFQQKNIVLIMELAAERSQVTGDGVRLQQIIWNIFKNAVKFTPPSGQVRVNTQNHPETSELVTTISDTGMGMTRNELARAFEAFAQGDHGEVGGSRRFGGLGLGLAISRRLVEAHGGRIRASSKGRDQGSSFTITLPSTLAAPVPTPAVLPSGKRIDRAKVCDGLKILLVEDHAPTRTVLAQLLTRRRYHVKSAASLAEARALSVEEDFRLLISDIGLPDGDGLELMKELRVRHHGLQGIALTGFGMEQDLARSVEAGFAFHLIKPVSVESLEAALAAVGAVPIE